MQRVGSCSASRAGFGSLAVGFMNDHIKMDSADTVVLSFAISVAALAVRLMDRLGARGKAGRMLQ